MVRADIVKRRGKDYVKITCDICGNENYYRVEDIKIIVLNGYDVHCKKCGTKFENILWSGDLERRIALWKKARRRRRR